ncbi:MAG: hypothetical protein V2I76_05060 [Roseobacter sp.]|nr:hypothetical protein [Roseobacter sp.]
MILIVGWAAYFFSVSAHFKELYERVGNTANPSQELLDEAYSDGGPLVFGALFVWLVALIYAAPWFVLFLMATWVRRVIGSSLRGERRGAATITERTV